MEVDVKAIVIDDEPGIAETIEIMLQRRGWDCVVLHDSVGLDVYLTKFSPDIVITDYNLPGDDGLNIARKVKMKGIPCAIITGFLSSQLQERDSDIVVIQKPFTSKELNGKINELLSIKQ